MDCAEIHNLHRTGAGLTDLGELGSHSGEGHGGCLARGAIAVAPVAHLVSGQEVARPAMAPPFERLEPLILKHLLLHWSCSYMQQTVHSLQAQMPLSSLDETRFHMCMFIGQVWSVSSCWLLLVVTCSSNRVQLQVTGWSRCMTMLLQLYYK